MKPDVTESILRLQFSKATVFTLDVAKLARMWVDNGHTLCHEKSNWQTKRPEAIEEEEEEENEEANRKKDEEDEDLLEDLLVDDEGPRELELTSQSVCFVLINAAKEGPASGLAMTAVGNSVRLHRFSNSDDQVFFWSGRFIGSKVSGKVLEGKATTGESVLLSLPERTEMKELQLFKKKGINPHTFKIVSMHEGWLLDIIDSNLNIGLVSPIYKKETAAWKYNIVDCIINGDVSMNESGFHEDDNDL